MTADPARFRRLMTLVGEAMERAAAEREAWIAAQCADDPELLHEARSLLAQATTGGIDSLAAGVEARIAATAQTLLPVAIPDRIGPYRVTGLLGEGGMGFVYAGHQESPIARDVAIKVVRGGLSTPSVAARFDLERRTLATLQHPHIAGLFDAGATADGLPYFAMELVRGVPITEYCDRHRLSIEARLDLFRQVLSAVHHAHQKAVVHRDLKPSNILVAEVDGVATPKVIDFGIARVLSGESGMTTAHTGQHALLGTREYMSPEQLSASADTVDTRSDIYSLAVLLYELLTGLLPFPSGQLRSASPLELERLIRDTDPPPPSRQVLAEAETGAARAAARGSTPRGLARSLQGDLDTIVGTAMRKDPAHRYPSAAQFAEDIGRYRSGLPIAARPATLRYYAGRFIRRHRVGVAGTATALVVLFATIGAF
ncbi:MAG: serine/threonine-protein kinase, partial [Gemmatimonadales bacterium]